MPSGSLQGPGWITSSLGIVSEGLEFGDSSVRETIAVHLGLHALPIFQWGTDEQKQIFAAGNRTESGLLWPGQNRSRV
ncbi:MAG: acyl-CoA dehydrogenase family protein [Chloroflexota bacterium]